MTLRGYSLTGPMSYTWDLGVDVGSFFPMALHGVALLERT